MLDIDNETWERLARVVLSKRHIPRDDVDLVIDQARALRDRVSEIDDRMLRQMTLYSINIEIFAYAIQEGLDDGGCPDFGGIKDIIDGI